MRGISEGDLCLLIDPAIDAGKSVTALKRVAPQIAGIEPRWYVTPQVRCRKKPAGGEIEYMGTTNLVPERLLMPIPPRGDPEEVKTEDAVSA